MRRHPVGDAGAAGVTARDRGGEERALEGADSRSTSPKLRFAPSVAEGMAVWRLGVLPSSVDMSTT
jgi:hypothetical protein